jgi:leucyl aminopeptidase
VTTVQLTEKTVSEVKADVLALYLFQGQAVPGGVEGDLKKHLTTRIRREKFEGRKNEVMHAIPDGSATAPVHLVVGLGEVKDFNAEGVREAVGTAAGKAAELRAARFATTLPAHPDQADPAAPRIQEAVEGALLAVYRFDKYLNEERRKARPFRKVTLCVPPGTGNPRSVVRRAESVVRAVCLARDLVNEPAMVLTPAEMERRSRSLARTTGLTLKVLGPAEMKREKMGAFLAVAQGSSNPPRLLHLTYRPDGKARGCVALVGKGITFDSGGLSLKPNEFMTDMKCDMSGSAAVLAVMSVLADLSPRVEVHGFLAMAENMPSARAYRPGDVLVTRSGKTVEVNNTDAEGRLLLACCWLTRCTWPGRSSPPP